jgi:hypothetical protein
VTVNVPAAAGRDEIDMVLLRCYSAFAMADQDVLTEGELVWECRRCSRAGYSLVLCREFDDPGYPEKLGAALRALTERADPAVTLH